MSSFIKKFPKFLFGILFLLLIVGFFGKRVLDLGHSKTLSFPKRGIVTAVYDGDTIQVRFKSGKRKKIRLIGIDAPEIDDSREKAKFLAFMAKRFTFFHLYRKEIKLSYDWQLEDKYGRLLAYIWSEREGLFNKFILKQGFASVFLHFPFRNDYRKGFKEAEREAQKFERGIWKKGSYPSISVIKADEYIGRIVSVVYTCYELDIERKFLFLRSSGGEFSALIPRENISIFPGMESFRGKTLSVTGFLEEYKGQPQIFVFLPSQIQIKD